MDETLLLVVYLVSPVDNRKHLNIKKLVSSKEAAAIVLWEHGIHNQLIEMGAYMVSLYSINLGTSEINTITIPTLTFVEGIPKLGDPNEND